MGKQLVKRPHLAAQKVDVQRWTLKSLSTVDFHHRFLLPTLLVNNMVLVLHLCMLLHLFLY